MRWLFEIDETGFYLCEGEPSLPPGGFFRPVSFFRQTGALAPAMAKWQRFAGGTAWQIVRWYRDTRFCSRCGGKLTHSEKERMLYCEACGQTVYPRISPALIIAVYDGRGFMSRYRHSRDTGPLEKPGAARRYMEVGETPDRPPREVWEETGVRIKNVRYYKSQPWALTDTLLLGIVAELDGSDKITLQEDELSAAGWVHRQEIVRETNDFSLTNDMICAFASGRL
ncbi:MAG: NAD(+) diphosphatase [Acutalibacteraceae bacterium]